MVQLIKDLGTSKIVICQTKTSKKTKKDSNTK